MNQLRVNMEKHNRSYVRPFTLNDLEDEMVQSEYYNQSSELLEIALDMQSPENIEAMEFTYACNRTGYELEKESLQCCEWCRWEWPVKIALPILQSIFIKPYCIDWFANVSGYKDDIKYYESRQEPSKIHKQRIETLNRLISRSFAEFIVDRQMRLNDKTTITWREKALFKKGIKSCLPS